MHCLQTWHSGLAASDDGCMVEHVHNAMQLKSKIRTSGVLVPNPLTREVGCILVLQCPVVSDQQPQWTPTFPSGEERAGPCLRRGHRSTLAVYGTDFIESPTRDVEC